MYRFDDLGLLCLRAAHCAEPRGGAGASSQSGPPPQIVTVLPAGYRTRVYQGATYYDYGGVYYRSYPSGGYEVVERPY